jgi:Raf kinase inhibitor-like YbhB/YbcL family protein
MASSRAGPRRADGFPGRRRHKRRAGTAAGIARFRLGGAGKRAAMPRDRDQQTPSDPDDARRLATNRGQGTAGTGRDLLPDEAGAPAGTIEVSSEAFDDGDRLPTRFAHDRENLSPPLEWSGVPEGTAELAVLCEDPDAPSGTFTHWVMAGIDPSTAGVAEGTPPAGAVMGTNGFGEPGWGGPEPPPGHGPHRYVFTVVASAAALDLDPGASIDDLRAALGGHELAHGRLTGLYERSSTGEPV